MFIFKALLLKAINVVHNIMNSFDLKAGQFPYVKISFGGSI